MGAGHDRAAATPTLTFLGAAGTVTGSKFLLEHGPASVLVDAGLYQGLAELRRRNWEPLPLDASALDAVLLTHAHLDHCGYLPRLVVDGFRGHVVSSEDTAALAAIVLRDSAHLQEEDARYANQAGFSKHRPALPLYAAPDVEKTLPLFRPTAFGVATQVAPGVHATLRPAGHILGSATVELETGGRRVLFSGDLGRDDHPLLRAPSPPPAVDAIVVESTYGDRLHPPRDPDAFADVVRRTVARGGSVLVPAFAVDRTELVLLELHRLTASGAIPRLPVYVDSPMALAALDVYRRAVQGSSPQLRRRRTTSPGRWPGSTCTASPTPSTPASSTARRTRASWSPPPAWPPADASCTTSPTSCPTRATAWCSPATRRRGPEAASCSTERAR